MNEGYQVKLPVFEGPFDLLYHLIEEQKIDLYDIPIAQVAEQYLEYIQLMEILDMEIASDFLVMAATLLEIKSKMLLPKERPLDSDFDDFYDEEMAEEDARAELVERLIEYKSFKEMAAKLREMEQNASRIYVRQTNAERSPEEILEINVGPYELLGIYHALVKRRIAPPVYNVVLEKLGVAERINELRIILKTFKGDITFKRLTEEATRYETVLSFMAMLEMTKTGEITFNQKENFSEIHIKPIALKQAF